MKTKGFYWHIHHDVLCEWSDDINERIRYIKTYKPENERALRLRLMKPVKGKLPARFGKAWVSCKDELEALHKKECRGCPWDGKTIFPEKVNA